MPLIASRFKMNFKFRPLDGLYTVDQLVRNARKGRDLMVTAQQTVLSPKEGER